MSTQTSARHAGRTGTTAMSAGMWIALAAAIVQFTALGSDFYQLGETVRDAWFGIPHASQLVLLSAATTFLLAGLAAAGRSPVSGRAAGVLIALAGLLAAAQVGYRMAVPPFKGCLTFNCGFAPKAEVTLLFGIWMAFGASLVAILGGVMHAASSVAKEIHANFWRDPQQPGMTPWLGLAALSAAAMVLVGYLLLPFYTVTQSSAESSETWTGWMAVPHTAGLVLLMSAIVVGLVVAAGRGRSPMSPTALGSTIAILALVATVRTAYRIAVAPFYSGPAEGVFQQGADINLAAWLALAFGLLTVVAGIVHAAQHRDTDRTVGRDHATERV